jgi:hypothetical protein
MIHRVTTKDPVKNKVVMIGLYDDVANTFTKPVTSEHFMVAFNGYGIQFSTYERLLTKNATVVIKPAGKSYKLLSSIKDWELLGHSSSIGGGKQRFLSVSSMKKI